MNPIAEILLDWYAVNGRTLPWRATCDPYRIWLSEIILQQTRVAQGRAYYERFTERFPDVRSLAEASEDEVLRMWQGLGYYSRARNLLRAARQVVEEFGGRFPATYEEVRRLRGVGDYTAAAICSMAYNLPCAVVDGNVYRVLSRLYDEPTPIDSTAGRKLFAELARETMSTAPAGLYNQAIMDFGAMLCTPAKPDCDGCPLADKCEALAKGRVDERPVKQARTQVRDRWFHYLDIRCGDRLVLHRRAEGDIWAGLYELPLIEKECATDWPQLVEDELFRRMAGDGCRWVHTVRLAPHRLTHRLIHATVFQIEVTQFTPSAESEAIPLEERDRYALPKPLVRYFEAE